LLKRLTAAGIAIARVTLHVGLDTFRPVSAPTLEEHKMHSEWCQITPEARAIILASKAAGGRTVAVGTTSVRVLESAARAGSLAPFSGPTDLFIRPPYTFRGRFAADEFSSAADHAIGAGSHIRRR
jgi:S-adenosylmethionine:tRNA ribosyltransferase-isomerase